MSVTCMALLCVSEKPNSMTRSCQEFSSETESKVAENTLIQQRPKMFSIHPDLVKIHHF